MDNIQEDFYKKNSNWSVRHLREWCKAPNSSSDSSFRIGGENKILEEIRTEEAIFAFLSNSYSFDSAETKPFNESVLYLQCYAFMNLY